MVTTQRGLRPAERASGDAPAYGVKFVKMLRIKFDDADYIRNWEIPPNTLIDDVEIFTVTTWNSATSATLAVGDTADPDGYVVATANAKASPLTTGILVSLKAHGPVTAISGAYINLEATTNTINHWLAGWYPNGSNFVAAITSSGAVTAGETLVVVHGMTFFEDDIIDL